MKGCTIKEMNRRNFFKAFENYKRALRDKKDIVKYSVAVHFALGADGVPKLYGRFVRAALKQYELNQKLIAIANRA